MILKIIIHIFFFVFYLLFGCPTANFTPLSRTQFHSPSTLFFFFFFVLFCFFVSFCLLLFFFFCCCCFFRFTKINTFHFWISTWILLIYHKPERRVYIESVKLSFFIFTSTNALLMIATANIYRTRSSVRNNFTHIISKVWQNPSKTCIL